MADIPEKIQTWQMIQPTTFDRETKQTTPGKMEKVEHPVPDLEPGEALVEVAGCGVCHTDLHYREGGINDEFPFLLGHEAAGTVEAVGEGVQLQIREAVSDTACNEPVCRGADRDH